MSEFLSDIVFTNEANAKHYHDYVGSGGDANFRRLRADKWKLKNPGCWSMTQPPNMLTTAEQNAFRYKVEPPPAPVIVLVDSRPAHEGYPDTFNFDVCHPALRR